MKKLLSISFSLTLLTSCANDALLEPPNNPALKDIQYTNRNLGDAYLVAEQFLSKCNVNSRNASFNKFITSSHIILDESSRSNTADTLMYAFDISNDGGFILVAAPQYIEPIIGIVDQGSYNNPENIKNEPYQLLLENIKSDILSSKVIKNFDKELPDTSKFIIQPVYYYDTINIRNITEPAVKVAWNQSWPENIYAPNQVAGCVPVAIAQLLSVFEKPTFISYTFPNRDINEENISWNELLKHRRSMRVYNYSDYDGGFYCTDCDLDFNSTHHNTIGRLTREIGHLCKAQYSSNIVNGNLVRLTGVKTGTYAEEAIHQLSGLKAYSKGINTYSIMANLRDKGVALIYSDSHAWIADGIIEIKYTINRYDFINGKYTLTSSDEIENKNLIHYNWGWGGNCNGFFKSSVRNPNNSSDYDYTYDFNISSNDFSEESYNYIYYKK